MKYTAKLKEAEALLEVQKQQQKYLRRRRDDAQDKLDDCEHEINKLKARIEIMKFAQRELTIKKTK